MPDTGFVPRRSDRHHRSLLDPLPGLAIVTPVPWLSQDLGWPVCASLLWAPGNRCTVNDKARGGDTVNGGLTAGGLRVKGSTRATPCRCCCHHSILQVRKLRLAEVRLLVSGHEATGFTGFTATSLTGLLIKWLSQEAPA